MRPHRHRPGAAAGGPLASSRWARGCCGFMQGIHNIAVLLSHLLLARVGTGLPRVQAITQDIIRSQRQALVTRVRTRSEPTRSLSIFAVLYPPTGPELQPTSATDYIYWIGVRGAGAGS